VYKLIPKESGPLKQKPSCIAIGPPGRFTLSVAAVETLTRDYLYEYVLLFWDSDTKMMAMRPTRKKDSRAYRVTYSRNGRNAAIAAKRFCEQIGLDYSRHRSYPAAWNDAEPGFEINLSGGFRRRTEAIPIRRFHTAQPMPELTETELSTWYTRADARRRFRIGQRTLDRFVDEEKLQKTVRPTTREMAGRRSGRRSDVVYNPAQLEELIGKMRRRKRTA
jgi:hypothetical protein